MRATIFTTYSGIKFTSQTQLKQHIQKIVNTIGICDDIEPLYPEYYNDLCELFKRHPNYVNKIMGFTHILIRLNPEFNNKEVCIKNKNGEIEDTSALNICITGKLKNKLKIAMRVAINPQIINYKNQTILKCVLCPNTEWLEVDHHSEIMPFEKLYRDFMNINKLPIPTEFDNTRGNEKCFQRKDFEFKNSWIEYHKNNCILRILCKSCNRSQPKYKDNDNDD